MGKWVWVRKEQDDKDGTHSPIVSLDVLKNGELFTNNVNGGGLDTI